MDAQSLWMTFFKLPFAPYLLVACCALLACVLLGCVLRLLLRLFFRRLRYVACLAVGALLLGGVSTLFYQHPIVSQGAGQLSSQMMEQAEQAFKGAYSTELPLLAWRIRPLSDDSQQDALHVEVSYLPFGKVVLRYDPLTRSFQLAEGLAANDLTFLQNIFSAVGQMQPRGLSAPRWEP